MSFSNSFKARMNVIGSNHIDRMLKQKQRNFEYFFNNTLNRYLVDIDGIEQYVVIQDQNQNNNKDLSDDKYVLAENSSNMRVGSLISWDDEKWLVFTDEHKTIKSHRQSKIKRSNHVIKWTIGEQEICNNGEGYHAFVQNQTLYTLGVSTSGNYSWIVNAKMMMYLPDNEESRKLGIGRRVFIGGNVYQVMFADNVSRNGLINYLLEEDFVNKNYDNVELEVANYYGDANNNPNVEHTDENSSTENNEQPIESPDTNINTNTASLLGSDSIKIGKSSTFTIDVKDSDGNIVQDDVIDWTLSDVDGVATVVSQNLQSITIKISSNFDYVGSIITVFAKTASGLIASKVIDIKSAY